MGNRSSAIGGLVVALCLLCVLPRPAQAIDLTSPPVVIGFLMPIAIITALLTIILALIAYRQALRLAEFHRDVFAAVPEPRQVVAPGGKVSASNPAFVAYFGGNHKPIPELLRERSESEEDRQALASLESGAQTGAGGEMELAIRGEKDALNWVWVAAYPVPQRPGYVFWFVDDITKRKQMASLVREEQERFVDLLENAPIGFYSVDAEGRFLFANQTLQDWLDLDTGNVNFFDLKLHDVLFAKPAEEILPYMPFETHRDRGEVLLKRADGESFRAYIGQALVRDEHGRVLRTRSVVRHLSQERAVAEALELSEQRFQRFFDEAPIGIALLDASRNINECNAAFASILGQPARSLIGKPLNELVAVADQSRVEAILTTPRQGGSAPSVEARMRGKAERICSLYLSRMERAGGGAVEYILQCVDVSEQKSLEMQFAQAQKMQAVGQLAGGIAHDFNNLLTAMIGFSDLLLLRHRPGDTSFADVMQIKQNANRAANLVRQLLAFSRQQTLQPRVLSVTDILAELSHLLRRLIGENIELKMSHGRDIGAIRADQGQLEQVIINLVVNARDAMPAGGTITVRTSNEALGSETKVRGELLPAGDYVKIEVQDTGVGIAPENLDRIFEPFFSTKEVGAGTGLGLSTVYGIVSQTGGAVTVLSSLGEGTTFTILLPQYQFAEGELAVAEAEAAAGRDLTGSGTLLLVEDEDAVRAFSARALRNKGYNVLEANSGEAALELLDKSDLAVDLLITDIVMPRIDGPTLAKKVRERHPDMRIIFISGYAEHALRRRLDTEIGIHFLPKPFSLKQLAVKVKEVMREHAA